MLPALASQSRGTDHELEALGNKNTCINDDTGFIEMMYHHSLAEYSDLQYFAIRCISVQGGSTLFLQRLLQFEHTMYYGVHVYSYMPLIITIDVVHAMIITVQWR